jgi:hypothetical protein
VYTKIAVHVFLNVFEEVTISIMLRMNNSIVGFLVCNLCACAFL